MSKYSKMTEEQRSKRNEYKRKRRAEHREEHRERQRKCRAEHPEEIKERHRKQRSRNLNASGDKKSHIRLQSRRYLSRKHSKLEGYEIHHCFGYEDRKKFIYIPKTLHLKIHQLLRENNIPADSDHWMAIRDLVNSCEQYTYISV